MKNNMMSVLRSAGVRSLIFIVAFAAAGGDAFASCPSRFFVSLREKPAGVNGEGLETVSGDVRLPCMDAEYDVATDTLVRHDGTDPVTNFNYLARRYDTAFKPLDIRPLRATSPVWPQSEMSGVAGGKIVV